MTETSTTAGGAQTSSETTSSAAFVAPLDVVVVCVGLGLTLAFVPFMFIPSYTPRLALVVALAGLGIVGVFRRAAGGDHSARVAALLCLWILLSAVLSGHPLNSLIGVFGRESSGLILAGSVLAWGAARELGSNSRQLFERLLPWALVVNAAVGLAQIVFNIESGSFQLYGGRATGLLVSHVAFGACMAGGAALVASRIDPGRDLRNLVLIALFAAMANLSGSRFAVAAGLVATSAVFLVRTPRRRAVLPTLSYLGGFAVSVLATMFALPGESATERVASAGGAGRFDAWGYGLQAVLDRPLLGWGPGRFRAAVQGRFSAEFTGANARNEVTQIWWDAHNIVVNVAVTLGIVGLGLAMAFAVFAVAQARGPLAWFAAVVASSWLLQPAGLATLPLVLLCLGAATAASSFSRAAGVGPSSARDNAAYVAILCGVAAASLFVLADVQVEAAIDKRSPDELASAANRVPWDPVVADLVSQAYSLYGTSPADLDHAIEWAGEAVERESDRPLYLNRLAVLQLATGQTEAARTTLDRALSRQPWNVQTWSLLGVVAERSSDDELGDRVAAASCAIEGLVCEPDG